MAEKHEEPEEIVTLVAEPDGAVCVRRIVPTVETMREIVGRDLREICPYTEPIALLYNASGDRQGLPRNLFLKNGSGQPYGIICGTFMAVGVRDGAYVSLTEEQIRRLRSLFLRDRLPRRNQSRPETDRITDKAAGGENRWRPVVLRAGKSINHHVTADRFPAQRKTVP